MVVTRGHTVVRWQDAEGHRLQALRPRLGAGVGVVGPGWGKGKA